MDAKVAKRTKKPGQVKKSVIPKPIATKKKAKKHIVIQVEPVSTSKTDTAQHGNDGNRMPSQQILPKNESLPEGDSIQNVGNPIQNEVILENPHREEPQLAAPEEGLPHAPFVEDNHLRQEEASENGSEEKFTFNQMMEQE